MSDDELLSRATRALRDGTAPSTNGAEEMLARIERSRLPSFGRRRARLRVAAWAFAATLVGVGAWASAGGRIARLISGPEEQAPAKPSIAAPSSVARRAAAPVTLVAPAVPAPSAEVAAPPAPTAASSAQHQAQAMRQPGVDASAARQAPPVAAPEREVVDENELYRVAHRLHFAQRDWASALAAWDRYLAAAGAAGSMVVEARYNRGLVLVRLGRPAEARQALEPFAAGEYGGYRREEARAVLDTLSR